MCDKKCPLSFSGSIKELMKFKLSKSNLPYKKCQNFPKIIKSFVKSVGIETLIRVVETVPVTRESDYAAAVNDAYLPYKVYKYNGNNYNIRFTFIDTDGVVLYDSSKGKTDISASSLQLHTTRMEFQRASEKRWGAQLRPSTTVNILQEYSAIWIPNLIIRDYPKDPLNVSSTYGFRFSVDINPITGEYQPLLI